MFIDEWFGGDGLPAIDVMNVMELLASLRKAPDGTHWTSGRTASNSALEATAQLRTSAPQLGE